MNFEVVQPMSKFQPFSVRIDIQTSDELVALTIAAGRMCNGHGNDLYDFLRQKCRDSIPARDIP